MQFNKKDVCKSDLANDIPNQFNSNDSENLISNVLSDGIQGSPLTSGVEQALNIVKQADDFRKKTADKNLSKVIDSIAKENKVISGSLSIDKFSDVLDKADKAMDSEAITSVVSKVSSVDATFLSQRMSQLKDLAFRSKSPTGIARDPAIAGFGQDLFSHAKDMISGISIGDLPEISTVTKMPGMNLPLEKVNEFLTPDSIGKLNGFLKDGGSSMLSGAMDTAKNITGGKTFNDLKNTDLSVTGLGDMFKDLKGDFIGSESPLNVFKQGLPTDILKAIDFENGIIPADITDKLDAFKNGLSDELLNGIDFENGIISDDVLDTLANLKNGLPTDVIDDLDGLKSMDFTKSLELPLLSHDEISEFKLSDIGNFINSTVSESIGSEFADFIPDDLQDIGQESLIDYLKNSSSLELGGLKADAPLLNGLKEGLNLKGFGVNELSEGFELNEIFGKDFKAGEFIEGFNFKDLSVGASDLKIFTSSDPMAAINDLFAGADTAKALDSLKDLEGLGEKLSEFGAIEGLDSDLIQNNLDKVQDTLRLIDFEKLDSVKKIAGDLDADLSNVITEFSSGKLESLVPKGVSKDIAKSFDLQNVLGDATDEFSVDKATQAMQSMLDSPIKKATSLLESKGDISLFFEEATGLKQNIATEFNSIKDSLLKERAIDLDVIEQGKGLLSGMRQGVKDLTSDASMLMNPDVDINKSFKGMIGKLKSQASDFKSKMNCNVEQASGESSQAIENHKDLLDTLDIDNGLSLDNGFELQDFADLSLTPEGPFDKLTMSAVKNAEWSNLL